MFCKLKKLELDEYYYASCLWSGDKLPTCPHCGQSPYEKSFKEFHVVDTSQGDE